MDKKMEIRHWDQDHEIRFRKILSGGKSMTRDEIKPGMIFCHSTGGERFMVLGFDNHNRDGFEKDRITGSPLNKIQSNHDDCVISLSDNNSYVFTLLHTLKNKEITQIIREW